MGQGGVFTEFGATGGLWSCSIPDAFYSLIKYTLMEEATARDLDHLETIILDGPSWEMWVLGLLLHFCL